MRRLITTTALTAAAVLVPTAAYAGEVARWHMDETSGSTMVDSSGVGNNGTVHGVVLGVPGLVSGSAYGFGGVTSYVEVPDHSSLNRGTASITVSATVQADDVAMPDDSYDLVRKGLTTTAGGDWKMEIKRTSNPTVGRLHCVFKGVVNGSRIAVSSTASVDVVDGRAHALQCVRTASSVQAVADGRATTVTKASGSISNTQPVTVGAKSATDDVLLGVLDEVSISIG